MFFFCSSSVSHISFSYCVFFILSSLGQFLSTFLCFLTVTLLMSVWLVVFIKCLLILMNRLFSPGEIEAVQFLRRAPQKRSSALRVWGACYMSHGWCHASALVCGGLPWFSPLLLYFICITIFPLWLREMFDSVQYLFLLKFCLLVLASISKSCLK